MPTANPFRLFLCFLFCSQTALLAQETIPQLTYGLVKNDDLILKEWRSDSTMPAFVLGDVGTISMQLVRDYYGFHFKQLRRLKILKKEGFSYADIEIPYYSKDETQNIVSIRAQTIAPNGDKFAVDKANFVTEPLNEAWSAVKFTFPKLTEGCVIEYEYEIHSTRSAELHEWFFQDRIPTRFSVLNLDLLTRYEYTHLLQGKDNLNHVKPRLDSSSQRVFTTYYAKDLPGLVKEQYVTSINNHFTRARFQLANYTGINGVKREILTNWEKMASNLLENDNFGNKFLKKSNYSQVAEAAKKMVKSSDPAKEKIQKLYDFVNKNIQWDSTYSLLSPNTPDDVWQKRKGSSTELNLTLLALLKDAGVTAYPLLVSTQAHGKATPEYAVLDQFNHALLLVELGGDKSLLLDAGDVSRQLGLPSVEASNGKGWLLKKIDATWVEIKPTMNLQMITAKFDIAGNNMVGVVNTTYRHHWSAEHRNTYDSGTDEPEKGRINYWQTKNPSLKIEELVCQNCDKKQEALRETITCKVLDVVKTDKNLMYIIPVLKSDWDVSPFKLVNRPYPVEFASPFTEQYIAVINIPDGYKIEELPRDLTLSTPLEGALFDYQISIEESKYIKVAVKIQVNKSTFPPAEYADLKAMFRQMAHKFSQKVILKRVSE